MTIPLPGMAEAANRPVLATYDTYLEAQRAVDYLSDQEFPVEHTAIIGTDLRMVEAITGRLTYARAAGAGAGSGAWFGLLVGLLLTFFTTASGWVVLVGLGYGAAFGVIFAVVSYAMTGGRRDFRSRSQIVASQYSVVVDADYEARARQVLAGLR
jgi:hypothetical protein